MRSHGADELLTVRSHGIDELLTVRSHGTDELLTVRSHGTDELLTVRSHGTDELLTVRSHGADELLTVRSHGADELLTVRSHGCDELLTVRSHGADRGSELLTDKTHLFGQPLSAAVLLPPCVVTPPIGLVLIRIIHLPRRNSNPWPLYVIMENCFCYKVISLGIDMSLRYAEYCVLSIIAWLCNVIQTCNIAM